jgi:sec-independent protein translocase protein TatC
MGQKTQATLNQFKHNPLHTDGKDMREAVPEEDEEGGPVKTFLEHLEDLRWVLIKSAAALGVGVVVCLLAGDQVVKLLMWPLKQAKTSYSRKEQVVSVSLLSNRIGTFRLGEEPGGAVPYGSNRVAALRLEPVRSVTDSNLWFLRVRMDESPAAVSAASGLNVPIATLGPVGGFVVAFRVALWAGLVLAIPVIFYQVLAFVVPALRRVEKQCVRAGLTYGLGLFLLGVAFCYFILMPVALGASVQFSEWLGFSVPMWRAEDYVRFVSKFMLGMGLGFQVPVLVLLLVKLGVVDHAKLAAMRRYVVVASFLVGAMLTPPDVITQVMMAVPLQILYEASVWIAWYWERRGRKRIPGLQAA